MPGLGGPDGRRLNVLPANFDAKVFAQAEGPTTQSTELFSAISALVGFLFAFNAMLLTAPQRRRLIRDLRLDGYTPLEIAAVMLYDAFVLGTAGSLLGLLIGDVLSRGLLQTSPGYLSFAFPVGSLRVVAFGNVALSFAGGLIAAVVGIFLPLGAEAFAFPAIYGKRRPSTRRARPWLPTLCVLACATVTGVSVAAGIGSVQTAVLAFTGLLLMLLAILPGAFRATVSIFDRLQRPVMGIATHLAAIELRSNATRARSLGVAATGAVAVFGSVAIQGARGDLQRGLNRVSSEITRVTDLWISPRAASDALATTEFASNAQPRLAKLRSVAEVSVYRGAFLDVGNRRVLVLAPPRTSEDPIPASQLVDGAIGRANALFREGGWIALSQDLARAGHVGVGGIFTLPTPHPMRLRVAVTTTNLGWPAGSAILNADDFARAWGTLEPSAYEVKLKPGVSPLVAQQEIAHLLGPRSPLVVQSAAQREAEYRATQQQGLSRLNDVAALVLVIAAVAMATAMGALIWQRRPRLSSMKIDGFDHIELWRALVCESALLLGAGCSLGALFGLVGQLVLSRALVSVTGFPVVFVPALPIAAAIFAIVTVSAVAIVALPGYIAAQVKPALGD